MTIHAMPLVIGALCVMAIFYRYYHGFIAAKVAVLDDSRKTPAYTMYDGQNYFPTNKWVLFGHHFAAITGAGPLIGPVLAAQFGVSTCVPLLEPKSAITTPASTFAWRLLT